MKVNYKCGVRVIEKILDRVVRRTDLFDGELQVSEYHNGREHGYSLLVLPAGSESWEALGGRDSIMISFSENRNSDDTVVYPNTDRETGVPAGWGWEGRQYFRAEDVQGPVVFIVETIHQFVQTSGKSFE